MIQQEILILTDLSARSYLSVRNALHLLNSPDEPRHFQLLHTYAIPVASRQNIIEANDQSKKEATRRVREFIHRLEEHDSRFRLRGRAKMGTFSTALSMVHDPAPCPIVPIAVDHTPGRFPWETNDDLAYLMRNYPCPLLFLHPSDEFRPPRKMLLLRQEKAAIQPLTLHFLSDLAQRFDSRLTIFNQHSGQSAGKISETTLRASLNGLGHRTDLLSGQNEQELVDLLEELQPEFLAFTDQEQAHELLAPGHPFGQWVRAHQVDLGFLK